MPTISSLATQLSIDFPQFQFVPSNTFRWSPQETTVYYETDSSDTASLLHELSHAILEHRDYTRDIQLIELEQAAWHHAQTVLSPRYSIKIDPQQVDSSMNTYRDWLHARSTCPECHATGLQIKRQLYSCLVCNTRWRANDARLCDLRRFVVT